ncbi:MAG: FlgD immunoglobulin-like domain containing protein, partial [Draconibacterium sp.]
ITYSKDGGSTFQSSNVFSGLSANDYTVVVKDANDCETQTLVTIEADVTSSEILSGNGIECYPNPFKDEVFIKLYLLNNSDVTVEVYNQTGQRIRVIQNSKTFDGDIEFSWDGNNENNQRVKEGFYFVRVVIDNSVITRKIVLADY